MKLRLYSMNITLIAGYYPPEQCADTRLNKDLAISLSEMGHKVTVVVPFPSRNVSLKETEQYCENKCEIVSDNLKVIRVGSYSDYNESLLRRGISFLHKSIELYETAKKIPTDIYLVISTPPFLGYVAARLAKNSKVIYKLQDIFPDSLMCIKNYSEKHLLVRIFRTLEKWVYRNVFLIVTMSEDMKKTVTKRGVSEDKVTIIRDWIDEDVCYPVLREDNILFNEFKLDKNKFYVCYAGNIGLLQNVLTMVHAAKIVEREYPDIQFVVIGNGACKAELERAIVTEGVNNFHVYPMQSEKILAHIYSLGDVGIVTVKPDVTKIALPSKTWAVLSAGRPAICELDKTSELGTMVEKEQCGYAIVPGDSEAMAKHIIYLYQNQDIASRMGTNGREFILKHLTKQQATKKYEKILEQYSCAKGDRIDV